jgi:microcystin degradation protein MlrC
MRIAIGGLMHESNTFASQRTGLAQFEAGSLTRGADIFRVWKDAHHEMGGFIRSAPLSGFEIVPTTMAWATPGGPVDDDLLDEVVSAILDDCRREPIDGLLLALHGAMVTDRHPSADGEVLRQVREALGPDLPIVASLDFHGNVSPLMAEHANALVGYQTYPHVDQWHCGLAAAGLIARAARGEIRPVVGLAKPPMILNLLGQETDREPMSSLIALAREEGRRPGLLSVSVMAGFPYADVPCMGPSVIAVGDGDRGLAQSVAEDLAEAMWAIRHRLYVPCPSPEEAVRTARDADRRPVLLIDLGDNIGGGSAGDGTVLLGEILRQGLRDTIAVLYAPEAVEEARRVGPGGVLDRPIGGAVDRMHGDPLPIRGKVVSLHDGRWVEEEPRHGGLRHNDQGPTAVLEVDGPNTLVLNSLRTPPFSLGQLTSLGLDPSQARAIVVKAAVAYKAAYAPIAGAIVPVDTPGLTAINPARFPYRHIRRPMFPLDDEGDRGQG